QDDHPTRSQPKASRHQIEKKQIAQILICLRSISRIHNGSTVHMHVEHGSYSCELHFYSFLLRKRVKPVAQASPPDIMLFGQFRSVQRHASKPSRHCQHIVVEGASMWKRSWLPDIEVLHDLGAPAKGTTGYAATNILTQRGDVGQNAV